MSKVTMKCIDCGKETIYKSSHLKKLKLKNNEYRCISCYHKNRRNTNGVTFKCIDCGKEVTKTGKHNFHKSQKEWRCKKCADIKRSKEHISVRITKKCIDCGKERTDYPSNFKNKEIYRCLKCSSKQTGVKLSKKITLKCIDCGKEKSGSPSIFGGKTEKDYRCRKCASLISNRKLAQDPSWLENNKRVLKILMDPEIISKRAKSLSKMWEDPEYRKINTERLLNQNSNPEFRNKISKSVNELYKDLEYINHRNEGIQKMKNDPSYIKRNRDRRGLKDSKIVKICVYCGEPRIDYPSNFTKSQHTRYVCFNCSNTSEEKIGEGFWYGNHLLTEQYSSHQYCELWKDVNPRVHAFFNYECCLCGKKENDKSHVGHHVFYVKEACCWYDESGVYYTNLNSKDHKENDYCIGENPNYFVILCSSCHGKTNGKFENRKKWANYFKDMVDNEYDGKCYLTKEEYEIYKNNNL